MDVQFYHLLTQPLEVALPRILAKAQEAGLRSLVKCRDTAQVKKLDELLWTYSPDSFLPHGCAGEPQEDLQPILLSIGLEPKNQADFLIVTDGTLLSPPLSEQVRGGEAVGPMGSGGEDSPTQNKFSRLAEMFDGGNPESVAAARTRWKHYTDAGHTLSYYRQQENGSWKKEA